MKRKTEQNIQLQDKHIFCFDINEMDKNFDFFKFRIPLYKNNGLSPNYILDPDQYDTTIRNSL